MARETGFMVTDSDLIYMSSTLGFRAKTLPSASNECATKSEIINALYISEGSISDYSNNQLVPYQKIQKGLYVDVTSPQSIAFGGSTFVANIYDADEWTITGTTSWISASSLSGLGDGSSTFTISSNPGSVRSATITFTDDLTGDFYNLVINQAAYVPTYVAISLGNAATNSGACLDAISSPSNFYIYDVQTFSTATYLASTIGGTAAASGWYSNEIIARFWNGSVFTGSSFTCEI